VTYEVAVADTHAPRLQGLLSTEALPQLSFYREGSR
jgi:hypothetical protein